MSSLHPCLSSTERGHHVRSVPPGSLHCQSELLVPCLTAPEPVEGASSLFCQSSGKPGSLCICPAGRARGEAQTESKSKVDILSILD